MTVSVAVIGAGYAGLACAVELTRRGASATVFERSLIMGGRARLVTQDERNIDNGQHILLGAYTELMRCMRNVGASAKTLESLPLRLLVPGELDFRAARLPAPWHLAVGLFFAKGLDREDRKAVLRLMRHLKACDYRLDTKQTVSALLDETTQTQRSRELIWLPLCLAALNTPADAASAQVFATVLRDSLGAHASASQLLIPRTDLTELFPVQAARYLAMRRGTIYTATTVRAINRDDRGFYLEGDPVRGARYDHIVIATAPYHVAALLDGIDGCAELAAQVEAFQYEPITTIYLALGEDVRLPCPMIGLSCGPGQWAFDRGQLGGEAGLIAVVISTAEAHPEGSRESLETAVVEQLERQLGRKLPAPAWVRSITEKRATIACTPEVRRPPIRTPVSGLWLAGDYTASPYPATLESAVRSGVAVARAISQ